MLTRFTRHHQAGGQTEDVERGKGVAELRSFIIEGQRCGEFRSTDARLVASVLMNAMTDLPREIRDRGATDRAVFEGDWPMLFVDGIAVTRERGAIMVTGRDGRSAEQGAGAHERPRLSSATEGAPLPVLVLLVLAPMIGEVVGAAFRFSYLGQPLRAVAILCFYGAGVLLVREAVQRRGLNGWGLLMLAVAFAVLEEGLGLQTIFNPQGMDGETVYGRAFEVNWLWAVVVTGYHAVWSIVIPIVLTHLIFPAQRHTAWLSRSMLTVFAGVFALGFAVFVFISLVRSDFRLSAAQIFGCVAAVTILVCSAGRCRRPWTTTTTKRCPGATTVGWVGFGAGLAWLMLYLIAFIGTPAPFVVWTLAALVFAAAFAATLRRWVARPGWSRRHQLDSCLGAVLALWLFGLFLVANGGRIDDVVFHFVVLVALIVGYMWLRRRT